jgi:hypothetical protein
MVIPMKLLSVGMSLAIWGALFIVVVLISGAPYSAFSALLGLGTLFMATLLAVPTGTYYFLPKVFLVNVEIAVWSAICSLCMWPILGRTLLPVYWFVSMAVLCAWKVTKIVNSSSSQDSAFNDFNSRVNRGSGSDGSKSYSFPAMTSKERKRYRTPLSHPNDKYNYRPISRNWALGVTVFVYGVVARVVWPLIQEGGLFGSWAGSVGLLVGALYALVLRSDLYSSDGDRGLYSQGICGDINRFELIIAALRPVGQTILGVAMSLALQSDSPMIPLVMIGAIPVWHIAERCIRI